MAKVVVVVSGGMDSAVLLAHHVDMGDDVRAISINYGQRHKRELKYAEQFLSPYGVPHTIVDFRAMASIVPGSSQTDKSVEVPKGHYTAENMKVTVVPNRNMILLAIAAAHAIAHKSEYVSYAAHAGDHAIYPDCREEFVQALDKAIGLADDHRVMIARPFIDKTKAEIVRHGHVLEVPFELTYSCYEGKKMHCGECGTCVERREAFVLVGVGDPTRYKSQRTIDELLAEAEMKSSKKKDQNKS